MKLLFRLLLPVMSFILILAVLWLSTPWLLERFAHYQLAELGFTDIEIEFGELGLNTASVARMQAANEEYRLELSGVQANYTLAELLDGSVDSIAATQVVVHRKVTADDSLVLPDPALLVSLLNTAWHRYTPARLMEIDSFSLLDSSGSISLRATAAIRRQGENINGEINFPDARQGAHSLQIEISPGHGIDLQLQASATGSASPFSIRLEPAQGDPGGLAGQLNADLSTIAELGLGLGGWSGLLRADISYAGQSSGSGKDFSLALELADAQLAGLQIQALNAQLQGSVEENDSALLVTFSETSSLQVKSIEQASNRAAAVTLKFPRKLQLVQGVPLLGDGNGAVISVSDAQLDSVSIPAMSINNILIRHTPQADNPCMLALQLSAPVVERQDMRYEMATAQLDGSCPFSERMPWSIRATTAKLGIEDSDFRLPLEECGMTIANARASTHEQSNAELAGEASCQSSGVGAKLHASYRFDPANESGHVLYQVTDILPDSEHPLPGSVLKEWKEPFGIVSGTLSARGKYRWWTDRKGRDREALDMQLQASDAGGYYDGVLFSGLNYKDRLELLPTVTSAGFSELTISDIDVGMPVTDISAKVRYHPSNKGPLPALTLNDLTMSLFDGNIKGNDLMIDLNSDDNELILVVVGLDMAQIVAMQQLDGLQANGRLDGYIPVSITARGIKIIDGRIVAQQQGGQIIYKPAGGTKDIEQSAIGSELLFRILEDLQYESLTVDVDYQEDGEMDMQLAVKGISPNLDKKRPVHFNLNLQQNVLKLLQGLRYAEGLSKDIDRNVQEYFRKQKNTVN